MPFTKKSVLTAAIAWILLLGIAAVAVKFGIMPIIDRDKEKERAVQEKQKEDRLIDRTSSQSRYDEEVVIWLDGFKGHLGLFSQEFKNHLKAEKIKVTLYDDFGNKGNYQERFDALKSGKAQLAMFPLNTIIRLGSENNDFPGTAVYMVDATVGADAIVSYKQGVASLQDLDHSDSKIIYPSDSPPEFLAEIVVASFNMTSIPEDWRVKLDSAEEVYQHMLSSPKDSKMAWGLWEHFVSMALDKDPELQVLFNSSNVKDYILDLLFANREYLLEKPDVVRAVIEAYAKTIYKFAQNDSFAEIIKRDAGPTESQIQSYADNISSGIQWKNVAENYAYFGIDTNAHQNSLEDIIPKITKTMIQVGMIDSDPLNGNPSQLYYDGILRSMKNDGFHPGMKLNIISGVELGIKNEEIRSAVVLKALTSEQWDKLYPAADFKVPPIRFPRDSSRITTQGNRNLESFAQKLKDFPYYYINVTGQSRGTGNLEDDKISEGLALSRAKTVISKLVSCGVSRDRFRAQANLVTTNDWSGLNLLFSAGQQF